MEENEEVKEKNIDIKGTLEKFVKTDEPELSQEEAIMRYGESKKKKSNSSNGGDESDANSEEKEHLKRVKQELLAALERVKELERKIFGEETRIGKLNLKTKNGGGDTPVNNIEELSKDKEETQKERE